jgi:hypothetical protein
MRILQNAVSPTIPPQITAVNGATLLDSQVAYVRNNLPDGEDEDVDIVGFSFPQLPVVAAHEIARRTQQPCPTSLAPAVIPGLSPPEKYRNNSNTSKDSGEKKKPETRKKSSVEYRRKKQQVSFAPSKRKKEKEVEEEEGEAPVEVDVQYVEDTIATLQTPFSNAQQQQQQKQKKKRKKKQPPSSAAAEVQVEVAGQQQQQNEEDVEVIIIDEDDSPETKEPDGNAAVQVAITELQAAVQQARAMLPFPIPSAGLLAMASVALQNETPGGADSQVYLSKCLNIAATLIPAMATEIARLEQEKTTPVVQAEAEAEAPVETNALVIGMAPSTLRLQVAEQPSEFTPPLPVPMVVAVPAEAVAPVETNALVIGMAPPTLRLQVAEQPRKESNSGLVSLHHAAQRRQRHRQQKQQQEQQELPQQPQPHQTSSMAIDDPMDALNSMLGM